MGCDIPTTIPDITPRDLGCPRASYARPALDNVMKRIGFVGYDGVTALDLFGPLEVFDTANKRPGDHDPAYELLVLSPSGKRFTLEQGIVVEPHGALERALPLDTIIVPGGAGARRPNSAGPIVDWLGSHAGSIRRIATVCIGLYLLAETGLLEGCRATSHWRAADDIARRFPGIKLQPDALFTHDGPFYTSAGVTAGIDLSLALVEEDLGRSVALGVARDLVVYLKRSGGQMQFSEPLQFQTRAGDRFSDLADWILRNLRSDLSVEKLAARTYLSPRQFTRRFKATFGITPGDYVEKLRLDEARRRLSNSRPSLENVALSVGYASADAFRRAFERSFGVAPGLYRRQFPAQ